MSADMQIARRFLAAGGRFIVTPEGKPGFGMDMGPLVSPKTPEPERRRLKRIARAACNLVERRGAQVVAMVQQAGTPSGAWIVWEGC